jgi:outer membrane protein assembly factor BamB
MSWRYLVLPFSLLAVIAAALILVVNSNGCEQESEPDALHRPEPTPEEMTAWACAGGDWTHRSAWSFDYSGQPIELWRYELGQRSLAEPVAAGGLVFLAGESGAVAALDAATGQARWTAELDGPVRGAPAVDDERVYLTLGRGGVAALDLADGATVWRTELPDNADVGPVPYGNLLYQADESGALSALDRLTGELIWRVETGAPLLSLPAVDAERVYIADQAGVVIALGRSDGAEHWRVQLESGAYGGVTLGDQTLHVAVRSGQLAALRCSDGSLAAQTDVGHPPVGAPAFRNGELILASDQARLFRIDAAEMVGRWEAKLGDYPGGGPVIAGEAVICPTWFGRLRAYNLADGEAVWTIESPGAFCDARPTLDDAGRLHVLHQDGTLICYGYK